jgi:GNAT superfamily N-acetyltransferase
LGIGRKLVEAIFDWARAQRARTAQLIVTSNNDVAIEFYNRLGFTLTGNSAVPKRSISKQPRDELLDFLTLNFFASPSFD